MKAPLIFPDILLPDESVPMDTWPVIACDQFTSDEEYWKSAEQIVGENPSTLRLILPEIYLDRPEQKSREADIRSVMRRYLREGIFRELPRTAVFVRRTLSDGSLRRGIVVALDLEEYDFDPDLQSVVRASEQTIPERLPPRAAIRDGAAVESPHVLVLFDDPSDGIMNDIDAGRGRLNKLYDTPLMLGGGRIEGYAVPQASPQATKLVAALESLPNAEEYGYLFATGDGNHSLAAAKTVWTARKKAGASMDDPYRYCLVELVNVYDPGLPFHPIHRLVEGDGRALLDALARVTGGKFTTPLRTELVAGIAERGLSSGEIAVLGPNIVALVSIPEGSGLAVALADEAISDSIPKSVDYVHGLEDVIRAAENRKGLAVILPETDRASLFSTVATKGTLPRKAFSLGEARDKRYYLECRRLER